jgi:hypothetical protein
MIKVEIRKVNDDVGWYWQTQIGMAEVISTPCYTTKFGCKRAFYRWLNGHFESFYQQAWRSAGTGAPGCGFIDYAVADVEFIVNNP